MKKKTRVEFFIASKDLIDSFEDYLFSISDNDFVKLITKLVDNRCDDFSDYQTRDRLVEKLSKLKDNFSE